MTPDDFPHRYARTPPEGGFLLSASPEEAPTHSWMLHLKLLMCLGLSALLMVLDYRHDPHLLAWRSGLVGLLTPVQQLAQLPAQTVSVLTQGATNYQALQAANQELQRQLLLQQAQLHRLSELEAENRRLKRLLGSTAEAPTDTSLIARIVRVEQNPNRPRILLDKGAQHGVVVGQPLVDADGLVGQIEAVYPFTARAILINDAHHSMQLQVVRNGLRTVAVGNGVRGGLALNHVLYDQDIRVGDLLVTSGLDGIYPGGYPVARVTQVESDPGQSFAHITATPLSALNQLREILLLVPTPAALPLPP